MAEITLRRTGELLRRLFDILRASPEGLPSSIALKQLAESVTLSPYEAGFFESGGRRFDQIIRYATIDCSKAGWLVKQNGTWSVTEEGFQAYATYTDPAEFYREAKRSYLQWRKGQPQPSGVAVGSAAPDAVLEQDVTAKAAEVAFEVAEDSARKQLEQYLHTMNPGEFQKLVGYLLRAMGYHVIWEAEGGPDGGVDLVAHIDPLGTRAPRIKVQVKRVSDKSDVDKVRAFAAVLDENDVGIFVSLGGFTRNAGEFVRGQSRRRVTLVDFDRFVKLWVEDHSKLDDVARRSLPLTPVWFLTMES